MVADGQAGSPSASVVTTMTGSVLAIELNRPEKLNALDDDMFIRLLAAVSLAEADPAVRAVTLTGRGRGFCAGGDVANMGTRSPAQTTSRMRRHGTALITSLLSLGKPVIMGVNGPAVGGGFSLALAGDLILMSKDAYFAQLFVARGLTPDMGSTFLLPRQVGLLRAKELTFSGRRVGAAEALQLGLATAVSEPETLGDDLRRQAEFLASQPGLALALSKRLLNQSQENSLLPMLEFEAVAQGLAVTDPEHKQAVEEFRRRRADEKAARRTQVGGAE
jgi:2-(1,2-epoxy-1,2-dihydrophenyl)acetyl-CoA isomerase